MDVAFLVLLTINCQLRGLQKHEDIGMKHSDLVSMLRVDKFTFYFATTDRYPSVMQGDVTQLRWYTTICTQGGDTIQWRSKPFKYAYKKGVVMYAPYLFLPHISLC